MIILQYVQSFFNFGTSILGCICFTVLMTGYGSCGLYRTLQANAAFCFVLIFLPWIGCILALLGSKSGAIIYAIIIFSLALCVLICSSIILANGDMKDTWRTAKDEDQLTTTAPEVSGMIIYNICISQIVLIWVFLFGGAGTTVFAAKK